MVDMSTADQIDVIAKSARALGWKETSRGCFFFDVDGVKGIMHIRYNTFGDGEVHLGGAGYSWDYHGPSPCAPIILADVNIPVELAAMIAQWIGIKNKAAASG